MSTPELLTKQEVIEWISYYEEGHEIPDDIMVRLLYMAQRDAEKTAVIEHATKWSLEAYGKEQEAREVFEEHDCSEAMHELDEWDRVQGFLNSKINELQEEQK